MADTRPRTHQEQRVKPIEADPEETPLDLEAETSPTRRRWPWMVVAIVVIAGVVAATQLSNSEETSTNGEVSAELNTAEVVIADLEEVTTLDGTLGREAGDPIGSQLSGTVTAVPEAGDVLEQGATLFEIGGEPVVLMYGSLPAFRDITLTEDTTNVAARSIGTITWLPEEGAVIEQGETLFEVNGEPVVLLYGEVPAYRTMRDLSTDMTGDDVLQLEQALIDLGYATTSQMTVDGEFTGATESRVEVFQEAVGQTDDGIVNLGEVVFLPGPVEVTELAVEVGDAVNDGRVVLVGVGDTPLEGDDVLQLEINLAALGFDADGAMVADGVMSAETVTAVEAWQAATDMEVDGIVDLGEVVFLDGAVRVSSIATPQGSNAGPGGAVLQVTGNDIVITALLPSVDQGIVSEGDSVTIELPDNTRTTGIVTEVPTVATRVDQQTVFEITIVLDDPAVAGTLDEAPVEVDIVTDSVSDVVAVPVTALLALREGGYAVEVELNDGTTTLVAVDPGFFADGLVEVDSDGLTPGMLVVVP